MSGRFCEECGREADATGVFCPECGQQLSEQPAPHAAPAGGPPSSWFTGGFRRGDPKLDLPSSVTMVLWVTNTHGLKEQLGENAAAEVMGQLCGRTGITGQCCTLLLDLAEDFGEHTPTWQECVRVLKSAEDCVQDSAGCRLAALGLLGEDRVVPMAVFEDRTWSDPQVETDAVYASLSLGDPWEDSSARRFTRAVGRLPVGREWGAPTLARYWWNCDQAAEQLIPRGIPFGLGAQCWEAASQEALQSLGGGLVKNSPPLEHSTLINHWDTRAPWQYFNLHGTREEPCWYGEHEGHFPVAFLPDMAAQIECLNVIGVEACYGARFSGLKVRESVMLSALSHLTVAFLGSSRIAFGPRRPPSRLADIMIRDFLLAMRRGIPAGVAHLYARNAVARTMSQPEMDPHLAIKTLLSFNLFGDPYAVMGQTAIGLGHLDEPTPVVFSDTLATIQRVTDRRMSDLEERLQTMLAERHPNLRDIRPNLSSITGPDGTRHRWHWAAATGPFQRHCVTLTDIGGDVISEFESR